MARKDEIPVGEGRAFPYEDRMIAIFNDSGSYFAIDDLLSPSRCVAGLRVCEDGAVACPWHAGSVSVGGWRMVG